MAEQWKGTEVASSGTVAHYGCWPPHGWMNGVAEQWKGTEVASSGTVAHYGCWPPHGWMEWLSSGRVQR